MHLPVLCRDAIVSSVEVYPVSFILISFVIIVLLVLTFASTHEDFRAYVVIMDQYVQMIPGRSLPKPARKARTSFGEEILLKDPYSVDDNGCIVRKSEKRRMEGLRRRFMNPRTGRVVRHLRWWIPEIFASLLSITTLTALIIVVRTYDGRGLQHIDLPSSLTLNGLVAVLSTINRVALMVPIGSAMSQETWLWFSEYKWKSTRYARLHNLERLDSASRGAWGSVLLLFNAERR